MKISQIDLTPGKPCFWLSIHWQASCPGKVNSVNTGFKRRRARFFRIRLIIGRTTEGTLGRWSSAVANRARRSVGGGVLNKLHQASRFLPMHIACHSRFDCRIPGRALPAQPQPVYSQHLQLFRFQRRRDGKTAESTQTTIRLTLFGSR